ncbi:MAG: IclR family transcriptional regulator [Thermomicrobiales bacterium]|nr:IclR family transcriptional regulator [Thermomicrobiales bacterium]
MIDTATPNPDRSYRISAVEKAFAVLNAFCDAPHHLSLAEVSGRSGLSTNQAFRVLQTLIAVGYVRQEPESRNYELGPAAFRLIAPLFNADELVLAGRDEVDKIFDATGEISSVMAFDRNLASVCVYVRLNEQPLAIPTAIGSTSTELHAGAVGRLILAARSDDEVNAFLDGREPLKTYNAHTLTDREAIMAAIRVARDHGYAVSDEEIVEGWYGVAAPILDKRGTAVAAVTLVAPLTRAGIEERERHLRMVLDAAKRISSNLGYRAVVALG